MITPQFTRDLVVDGNIHQSVIPFTKAQLAELFFGTRSWKINLDVTVTSPMGTGVWQREFVARAGEELLTVVGANNLIRSPFSASRETVLFTPTYRFVNWDGVGGQAALNFPTLTVGKIGALYYPYFDIRMFDIVAGYFQGVGTRANGLVSTTAALTVTYDGRSYPLLNSRGDSQTFIGEMNITPEAW